ncbi:Transaldolase [Klebsormidium nitens]|uniref:Transaldolase n=2 Tax=Klebsormidium TaxID=3174 RepID=A0A1Y1ITH6_KLENI|nr:Transaldolase [Klebsormidium nitens]|eukprot:GAQ91498.1 Transaldolase [Klebsormidium nitens]
MAASSIASPVAQLVPVAAYRKASASAASRDSHWLCPTLSLPQCLGALGGQSAFLSGPILSRKGESQRQCFSRGLQVRCAKAATSGNVAEDIKQHTRLHDLYNQQGQSPWLDNLTRDDLQDGKLQEWVDKGIRGVTDNPSIFEKAVMHSDRYDGQYRELIAAGKTVEQSYWELQITDINDALEVLWPVYAASHGEDGYISIEVSPEVALDTQRTIDSARYLHGRINKPNLMIKIPATKEGVPAIQRMIAEGRNVNVTLIFSLTRYEAVIDAYLAGLEEAAEQLSAEKVAAISSVASFFVSRVDTEVDKRLDAIGTPEAQALKGKAAVAQAKLAYELAQNKFSGPRWQGLATRASAKMQRPLWASTGTKNAAYPDTLYVDQLIGPATVNTMPEKTIQAFMDHGSVARTVDQELDDAHATMRKLKEIGIDMEDVATTLEKAGLDSFGQSFSSLMDSLTKKSEQLTPA